MKKRIMQFNSQKEEYEYRLRHIELDWIKIAKSKICLAIEDLLHPTNNTTYNERLDAYNFLINDDKYWADERDFWCDVAEDYSGEMLHELISKEYEKLDNKVYIKENKDLSQELRKELPTYKLLCNEIKQEFFNWIREYVISKRDYNKYFSKSLLYAPFSFQHSKDLVNMMNLKKNMMTGLLLSVAVINMTLFILNLIINGIVYVHYIRKKI